MAEEKENPKEEDEHTPHLKRNDLPPSLTNCHSCGETLTDLQTLGSQWRIVVLCYECLRLIRNSSKCSYCFTVLVDEDPSLCCRHCSFRVHASCVPRQRRLFSPSDLDPDSFACVDCFPLRSRNPFLISRLTVEGLAKEAKRKGTIAVRAKEKAEEKARISRTASDQEKNVLVAVRKLGEAPAAAVTKLGEARAAAVFGDEELALQLHIAMNGSQRISRCGNQGRKGVGCTRICEKVELCREDKSFFDTWVPPVVDEPKKENNGVSENVAWEDNKNSSRDGKIGETLLKYFRRRAKSKKNSNTIVSKNGGEDTLDRYLMKYRRKSGLKAMMKRENQHTQCWQLSYSNESTLSDAPLSSLPGCQS